MRLQHNISPPAPGRGGYRKRKRGADDGPSSATAPPQESRQNSRSGAARASPPPATSASAVGGPGGAMSNGAFNTFKLEPGPYSELQNGSTNGHQERSPSPVLPPPPPRRRQRSRRSRAANGAVNAAPTEENEVAPEDDGDSSASDTIPAHLMPHYEPETGLVLGRTPAMVMYLLTKAKYRHAMEQRDILAEELKLAKAELEAEKEEKERALDLVLGRMLGCALLVLSSLVKNDNVFFPDLKQIWSLDMCNPLLGWS
jgi:hypothetical protein